VVRLEQHDALLDRDIMDHDLERNQQVCPCAFVMHKRIKWRDQEPATAVKRCVLLCKRPTFIPASLCQLKPPIGRYSIPMALWMPVGTDSIEVHDDRRKSGTERQYQ